MSYRKDARDKSVENDHSHVTVAAALGYSVPFASQPPDTKFFVEISASWFLTFLPESHECPACGTALSATFGAGISGCLGGRGGAQTSDLTSSLPLPGPPLLSAAFFYPPLTAP